MIYIIINDITTQCDAFETYERAKSHYFSLIRQEIDEFYLASCQTYHEKSMEFDDFAAEFESLKLKSNEGQISFEIYDGSPAAEPSCYLHFYSAVSQS